MENDVGSDTSESKRTEYPSTELTAAPMANLPVGPSDLENRRVREAHGSGRFGTDTPPVMAPAIFRISVTIGSSYTGCHERLDRDLHWVITTMTLFGAEDLLVEHRPQRVDLLDGFDVRLRWGHALGEFEAVAVNLDPPGIGGERDVSDEAGLPAAVARTRSMGLGRRCGTSVVGHSEGLTLTMHTRTHAPHHSHVAQLARRSAALSGSFDAGQVEVGGVIGKENSIERAMLVCLLEREGAHDNPA